MYVSKTLSSCLVLPNSENIFNSQNLICFNVSDADIPDLTVDMIDTLRSKDQKAAQLYEDIQKQRELIHLKNNTTFGRRLKDFAVNKYATFYRR